MPPISGVIPAVVRSASNFAAKAMRRLTPRTIPVTTRTNFPSSSPIPANPIVRNTAGRCDCLEAIELPSGRKIGALLSTDLTGDGVRYTREAIAGGGEVAELWAEEFSHYL